MKQELRTLQERLAQCSAESQRHKELLRCLVGVECSPCSRGLGPQTLSPCSPFRMQEEMQEDLRGAIEKLNSEVGVLSPAHVPELSWLGLRGWKGLLEVMLSCPTPLLKEGHLAPLAQWLWAAA